MYTSWSTSMQLLDSLDYKSNCTSANLFEKSLKIKVPIKVLLHVTQWAQFDVRQRACAQK